MNCEEEHDHRCLPILKLLRNYHMSPFPTDVFHYLFEHKPSSLELVKCTSEQRNSNWDYIISTETPLHMACSNPNITVEVVKLILDAHPEMIEKVNLYDGFLPIHTLCKNKDLNDQASMKSCKFWYLGFQKPRQSIQVIWDLSIPIRVDHSNGSIPQ